MCQTWGAVYIGGNKTSLVPACKDPPGQWQTGATCTAGWEPWGQDPDPAWESEEEVFVLAFQGV